MSEPLPPDDRRIPLPPLPPPPPAPKAGSRTGPLWLAGLALLAVGCVAAWWWLSPRRPEPPLPAGIDDPEVRAAIEHARQEVLDQPRSAAAWGRLGATFLAQLFDAEADQCLAEAASLDPGDARYPYGRALIALKRAPDRAVPLLRQALAADRSGLEYATAARVVLAETLLERQELDEAETLFREAHGHEATQSRAALGLGLVELARGRDREAEGWFREARESRFARKAATARLAALARARGDRALAEDYEKQTAGLPDDPPWPDPLLDESFRIRVGRAGRDRLVDKLEDQGRYEEAAQALLAQVRERPTSGAYVRAGVNLARLQRYDEALPLLRRGVELGPDSAEAHFSLGMVLFDQTARELGLTSDSPEVRTRLEEVIRHARQATQLRPDHAEAYLFWGQALKYLGQYKAALAPLRLAVACRPDKFEMQLVLGEVLLETGQTQEAEAHLENARRLKPTDPFLIKALERLRQKKP